MNQNTLQTDSPGQNTHTHTGPLRSALNLHSITLDADIPLISSIHSFLPFAAARLIRPDVSDPFHRRSPRMPSDPPQDSSRGRPGRAPWRSTRWSSRCPTPNGVKAPLSVLACLGRRFRSAQAYRTVCVCVCVR